MTVPSSHWIYHPVFLRGAIAHFCWTFNPFIDDNVVDGVIEIAGEPYCEINQALLESAIAVHCSLPIIEGTGTLQ